MRRPEEAVEALAAELVAERVQALLHVGDFFAAIAESQCAHRAAPVHAVVARRAESIATGARGGGRRRPHRARGRVRCRVACRRPVAMTTR